MIRLLPIILTLLLASGCANIVTSATNRMADNLSLAILNQDDPQTVRDGAPAYLLLVDSLIEGDPENVRMLLAGANLYGAYANVFVDDNVRAQRLTMRARAYAERALCSAREELCGATELPFDEFSIAIEITNKLDVPVLHGLATSWASWIQTRSDDWTAVADLPKVELLLERVVELDEGYDGGSAHLYLGVLNTQLPPALGGKPEVGRAHFERAIKLSDGQNLMAEVMFAKYYARLRFDQSLHDKLLEQVLATDPVIPGYTLMNTLAQQDARKLLQESTDYF